MFSIQLLVDRCRAALESDDPSDTVATVLRDAVSDPDAVTTAVAEWKATGRTDYGAIYRARDLTILHAAVKPGFESPRHNHTMWAVSGVYEGQEDNTFYRRGDSGIEEVGHAEIRAGEAQVLPADVIHRIANRKSSALQAIHVYGGDLLGIERSMWDDTTGGERRFDFTAPPVQALSS